ARVEIGNVSGELRAARVLSERVVDANKEIREQRGQSERTSGLRYRSFGALHWVGGAGDRHRLCQLRWFRQDQQGLIIEDLRGENSRFEIYYLRLLNSGRRVVSLRWVKVASTA